MRTPRLPIRHLPTLAVATLLAIATIPQAATGQRADSTLAAAITHTATRLVVTPWPGYLGFPVIHEQQSGTGFGVQFPVDAASLGGELAGDPNFVGGNSLLASGGLVIGVEPENGDPPVILTTQRLGGAFICPEDREEGDRCLAFWDGAVSYEAHEHGRKSVRWQYSDAMSSTAVGLTVVQESVDGYAPADYVLFNYTITNTSTAPVTFYAGLYVDWDVPVWDQNVGATDMGGHVMYNTAPDGPYVGTVLMGDYPVAATHFWPNANSPSTPRPGQPLHVQNVLRGLFPDGTPGGQTATGSAPADYRYVHSLGPITLDPDEHGQFWMAFIAGEDLAELRSNATAAATHVNTALPEPPAIGLERVSPSGAGLGDSVTVVGTNLDRRWDKQLHLVRDTWPAGCAMPRDVTVPFVQDGNRLTFTVPTSLTPGSYGAYVTLGGSHSNTFEWELEGVVTPITLSAIEPAVAHPNRAVGLQGVNLDQPWDKRVHLVQGSVDVGVPLLPEDGPSEAVHFTVPALDPGRYEVSVAMECTRSNALALEVRPPWVTTVAAVSGTNWWSPKGSTWDLEAFDGAITMAPNQRWIESSIVKERTVQVELRFADVVETDGEEQYRPADPAGEHVSLAYRYLRGAAEDAPAPEALTSTANPWDVRPYIVNQPTEGVYAYQDRRPIAVAAWDVSADPPRRLAIGFLENNVAGGLVNGAYGPAHWDIVGNLPTDGPREWLFVFDLPYQEDDQPELVRDLLRREVCPPDCPPYLAIVIASRAERDRFPQQGDVIRLSHGW